MLVYHMTIVVNWPVAIFQQAVYKDAELFTNT